MGTDAKFKVYVCLLFLQDLEFFVPTIDSIWEDHQTETLDSFRDNDIIIFCNLAFFIVLLTTQLCQIFVEYLFYMHVLQVIWFYQCAQNYEIVSKSLIQRQENLVHTDRSLYSD